jgi:3-hydroxyisobutyrate dehydrogenase
MTRVGFIGLGDQGQPMACRIADSGRYELSVYARRPAQAEAVMARGALRAWSVPELARRSEILGICVSDDAAVQEVLAVAIPELAPGSVIVIHSTIHPDTCKRAAELARASAVDLIDAPVSGGAQRGRDGRLTVMVGGDASVVAAVRPVLETFASTIVHAGDLGSGLMLKLVNNYLFALNREVARRATSILARLDLDVAMSTAAIAASTGGSECLRRVADAGGVQGLSRHAGGPQHGNALLAKDVALFRDLVSGVGGFSRPADEIIDSGLALVAESEE